jgi:hypothetical protein
MLCMFGMAFNCFCKDACFKYFIVFFFCMLQVLHLNISKVDRVLYMGCVWKMGGGTSGRPSGHLGANSTVDVS